MENNIVTPVHETEVPKDGRMKLTEVRFDAYVRMYDVATPVIKEGFLQSERRLPPQWFAIKNYITLEAIRDMPPEYIGLQVKEMLRKLEFAIKEYENKF